MRITRRRLLVLAGVAATVAAVAVTLRLDPVGLSAVLQDWLAVARPADGTGPAFVDEVARRQARVRQLEAMLDRDPSLSAAALSVGLGTGIVGGALGTFLYQRRRIRRGEWNG